MKIAVRILIALTLMMLRVSMGREVPRYLSGTGLADPDPVCSYTGINWNIDLGCTDCEHIVNVDALISN